MSVEIETLAADLERYNAAYRHGVPMIPDDDYDRLVARLKTLAPDHPFLAKPEPEVFEREKVRHLTPMLSLENAFDPDALEHFLERWRKAAAAANVILHLTATAKLDGIAAKRQDGYLLTRGDGTMGFDISALWKMGLKLHDAHPGDLGEIVVTSAYFKTHLEKTFAHPRNVVAGIAAATRELNPAQARALSAGAVRFVPYRALPTHHFSDDGSLTRRLWELFEEIREVPFPTDGVVVTVHSPELRKILGATEHSPRWAVAVKKAGPTAQTNIRKVIWQTGKGGAQTPVLELTPVNLSGARVAKVTAHHAGNVRALGLAPGAVVEIIRSGEVIPKILRVVKPALASPLLPGACADCGGPLSWEGDFLSCADPDDCAGRIRAKIAHWFRTLGTAKGFGPKVIDRILASGFDFFHVSALYGADRFDFQRMGFGMKQAANLERALEGSRAAEIEDWRFLAALGIPKLGPGDAKKLLARLPLRELVGITDFRRLIVVDGFAEKSARTITEGLSRERTEIERLLNIGFRFLETPLAASPGAPGTAAERKGSFVSGKRVLFTGVFDSGPRKEIQRRAAWLGAVVQNTLTRETDLVVTGDKPGAAKLTQARALGIAVITETDYLSRTAAKGDGHALPGA